MDGSAQNGVKKSGHSGLSQSQLSTCSLLREEGSCLMCPFVSGGGGVAPPVGRITARAGKLHYDVVCGLTLSSGRKGSVNMGICILGAHKLPSFLKGLHSQAQFSNTVLITAESPSLRKSSC